MNENSELSSRIIKELEDIQVSGCSHARTHAQLFLRMGTVQLLSLATG